MDIIISEKEVKKLRACLSPALLLSTVLTLVSLLAIWSISGRAFMMEREAKDTVRLLGLSSGDGYMFASCEPGTILSPNSDCWVAAHEGSDKARHLIWRYVHVSCAKGHSFCAVLEVR